MTVNEKQFENNFKRYLETLGVYRLGTPKESMNVPPIGYWVKRWGGGRYVQEGLPDMEIVINGVSLNVEVKTDNGKLSKLQEQKIQQIQDCGAIAYVLRPNRFIQFKAFLNEFIKFTEGPANAIQLFTRGMLQ